MGCNPASDERQTESRHGTRRGAKSRRSASNFGFWDGELVGGMGTSLGQDTCVVAGYRDVAVYGERDMTRIWREVGGAW